MYSKKMSNSKIDKRTSSVQSDALDIGKLQFRVSHFDRLLLKIPLVARDLDRLRLYPFKIIGYVLVGSDQFGFTCCHLLCG